MANPSANPAMAPPFGAAPTAGTTPNGAGLQLADIIEPAAISAWPPAPGWWLLGLILIVAVAALLWWLKQRQTQNRYRKAALTALADSVSTAPLNGVSANRLLKQVAMATDARAKVAPLAGQAWIDYLAKRSPKTEISDTVAKALSQHYQTQGQKPDSSALHDFCQQWIRQHQRRPVPEPSAAPQQAGGNDNV